MKYSPVKSVESWTIKNDGRDAKVTSATITVTHIAVRYPRGARTANGTAIGGRFHGATNFRMRGV